jgi:mRNA-degrading endonuclease RelE of RelBE toxin-antitoxin system
VSGGRYKVILAPAAERQLGRLRGITFLGLHGVIKALGNEPRPPGALKLTGVRSSWRLRVRIDGRPWRVIYRIDEQKGEVVVARVVARDEATYRGLR